MVPTKNIQRDKITISLNCTKNALILINWKTNNYDRAGVRVIGGVGGGVLFYDIHSLRYYFTTSIWTT